MVRDDTVTLSDTDKKEIDGDVKQGQSWKKAPLRANSHKRRETGVDFSGPHLREGKLFSCLSYVLSSRILILDFRGLEH